MSLVPPLPRPARPWVRLNLQAYQPDRHTGHWMRNTGYAAGYTACPGTENIRVGRVRVNLRILLLLLLLRTA